MGIEQLTAAAESVDAWRWPMFGHGANHAWRSKRGAEAALVYRVRETPSRRCSRLRERPIVRGRRDRSIGPASPFPCRFQPVMRLRVPTA
jgi:hypothetical protein